MNEHCRIVRPSPSSQPWQRAWSALSSQLRRLHGDQRGAEEEVNKLLIFALISLPLLALLIFFGSEIYEWAKDVWNRIWGNREAIPVEDL